MGIQRNVNSKCKLLAIEQLRSSDFEVHDDGPDEKW